MLDAPTMENPAPERGYGVRGQDPDHHQSPHGDSANSLTPPEERGRGQDRNDKDLRDIIRNRDACDQIETWHQKQDRVECERRGEGDYDY
jgi:hypothetical protein